MASGLLLGAIPAHAADAPPTPLATGGYVIEPAKGSGLYTSVSKLNCPDGSSSIMDCTYYGELTGSKYLEILGASSVFNVPVEGKPTVSIPLGVSVVFGLEYNALPGSSKWGGSIEKAMPIYMDSASKKIFFTFKLSDFYVTDYSDPVDFIRFTTSWDRFSGGYAHPAQCNNGFVDMVPDPAGSGSSPEDWVYANTFLGCSVYSTSKVDQATLDSYRDYATHYELFTQPSQVKNFSVSLRKTLILKTPTFADGVYVSMFGSDNSSKTYTSTNLKGGGFPQSENPTASSLSCVDADMPSASMGGDAQGMAADFHLASPSAAKMFEWSAAIPYNSCWSVNTARYAPPVGAGAWASDPSGDHFISKDMIDGLNAGYKPVVPTVGGVEYVRPAFDSCIDVNPLSFKWDWPCVLESLFVSSPAAMNSMTKANQKLLTRFPFNYLPMLFDASNKVFNPAGACSPLQITVLGATIPLIPCDEGFRGVVRPITTWGFSLFIALNVGSFVLRKFLPGLPGEK